VADAAGNWTGRSAADPSVAAAAAAAAEMAAATLLAAAAAAAAAAAVAAAAAAAAVAGSATSCRLSASDCIPWDVTLVEPEYRVDMREAVPPLLSNAVLGFVLMTVLDCQPHLSRSDDFM